MKMNRVIKTCPSCKQPFEVVKCREFTAKFCSQKCYTVEKPNKTPWNKGKSYDKLYDISEANRIRQIQSQHSAGKCNPMYGKHHSLKTKEIMSLKKIGYVPWNSGKKLPGMFNHINRLGENNAYIKYVLKEEGITYREYLSHLTDKEKYYKAVIRITRLQNIQILENYDKRANAPGEHAYHLDHIYPIIKGFEDNIPPEIIGDISNLRFIPWKENLQKADKLLEEARKILYECRVLN